MSLSLYIHHASFSPKPLQKRQTFTGFLDIGFELNNMYINSHYISLLDENTNDDESALYQLNQNDVVIIRNVINYIIMWIGFHQFALFPT